MKFARLIFGCSSFAAAASVTASPQPSAPIPSISRAIFLRSMDGEFGKIDLNRDGKADSREVLSFESAVRERQAQSRNQALFARLDTDRDGRLSQAEFAQLKTAPTGVGMRPPLSRLDLDGDSTISLIEYRTGTLANFDRMDIDKDGFVDALEMKAAGLGK